MRNVTVAATQMACSSDREINFKNAERLIRQAARQGANIVMLQELFLGLYFCQEYNPEHFDLAMPEENEWVDRMAALAKELNVAIPFSFFERAGQAFFNTIIMIDADGTKLGKYRKTHIPDDPGYYEKYYFSPGDTGFQVWKTKFANVGVGICWDQWFPEAARCMCLKDAEILLYPTAIGTASVKPDELDGAFYNTVNWRNTMAGHAAANVVPVAASNRIGIEYIADTAIFFYGSSFIADHFGAVVEEADKETETVLIHTFDLDEIERYKKIHPVFRDRRPEMYGTLMTLDGHSVPKR